MMKKIGQLLKRDKTKIVVKDNVTYKQVTIRTNYKGVRLRTRKLGATIRTKNQYLVKKGQFILSKIDARNGAFGIIPDELDGAIVTGDFMAYDINEEELNIDFFNILLQSPVFLEACVKASRGNTNRKRIQEQFFLNYELNIPTKQEQETLISRILYGKGLVGKMESEIVLQQNLITQLRQAILQEAIQGKLTQSWRLKNSNIESAEILLQRIKSDNSLASDLLETETSVYEYG